MKQKYNHFENEIYSECQVKWGELVILTIVAIVVAAIIYFLN